MLSSCYSKMTNHSGCEKMMKKGMGGWGLTKLLSDSVYFESNGVDDEKLLLSTTQPSSSVLTCLFSLCPNFSLFLNINLILFLLPNFFSLLSPPFLGCVWTYKNKRKFEGVTFLLLNRISCFLSLAGNSCLASLQGCRARMLN